MKKAILVSVLLAALAALWLAFRPSKSDDWPAVYASGQYSSLASQLDETQPDQAWWKANCLRQLGRFEAAMNVPLGQPKSEALEELMNTRLGRFEDSPLRRVRKLIELDVSSDDAHEAAAWGCIEQAKYSDAERVISAWEETDAPNNFAAQRKYLQLMLQRRSGQLNGQQELAKLISEYPAFELPPIALAEILTTPPNVDLTQAQAVLEYTAEHFPQNPAAKLKLASVLRKTGQLDASREIIEGLANAALPADELAREQAAIEFDSGKLAATLTSIAARDSDPLSTVRRLSDEAFRFNLQGNGTLGEELSGQAKLAATTMAMQGNNTSASEAFTYILDRVARTRRLIDVRARQMLFPEAQQLRDETNMLTSPAFAPEHPTLAQLQGWFPPTPSPAEDLPGFERYQELCAACHGDQGLGNGRAARHLKRGARNFQQEPIRIVSSANALASDDDLRRAIVQGQPSGGMPAFAELTDQQTTELVEVVRHFQRVGLQRQYNERLVDSKQTSSSEDDSKRVEVEDSQVTNSPMDSWVNSRMLGNAPLALPEFSGPTNQPNGDGKAAFRTTGCIQCHSDSPANNGSPATASFEPRLFHDSLGRPIQAPNLATEMLRGGNAPQDLYRRIKLGIPGTPHPSARALDDATILTIVEHIRSLRAPSLPSNTQ